MKAILILTNFTAGFIAWYMVSKKLEKQARYKDIERQILVIIRGEDEIQTSTEDEFYFG